MNLNSTLRERNPVMANEEVNAEHQKFIGLLNELPGHLVEL